MFGDGRGFTADLIVAGIISADRIEAGSITAMKLADDVGASIDLTGNSVIISVGDTAANALQTADSAASASSRALDGLAELQASTGSSITQMQDAINLRVTETTYNANNQAISQRIGAVEVRTTDIETSVQNLEEGLGTHFIVEPDKIRITQDQNQNWEQQLTADSMSFVNKTTGVVAASFGVNGGYADRLRSNQTLSVGTTSDGWYDMTALPFGVADKWRDGTDTVLRPIIITQPTDCYVTVTSGTPGNFTASVIAENVVSYKWQYRQQGQTDSDWIRATNASYNTNQYTEAFTTSLLNCLFRCELTGEDGNVVYTDVIRVAESDAPIVFAQPIAYESVNAGTSVTTTFCAMGVSTYQWQYRSGNSATGAWTNVGSNNPQAPSRTDSSSSVEKRYYRCLLTGTNGNVAATDEFIIEWK